MEAQGLPPAEQYALVTNSIGTKTASVTVQDNVGNPNSSRCSYTVGYNFSGLLRPGRPAEHDERVQGGPGDPA